MKVICIKGAKKGQSTIKGTPLTQDLEILDGEIYNAISEVIISGIDCYILQEKSKTFGYNKKRFIPLSDIDETELAKEREQLQTV